jgi:hypothetical protein
MIKTLRKRHRQIWMTLAVLLPVGIVFAWLAIPNQQPVKLLRQEKAELLPDIVKSADKKDYLVNLRSNKERTAWQLEWKNKTILTFPSAVIYKAILNSSTGGTFETFKPEQAELIGRIEAREDYTFPLKLESSGLNNLQFILYDFIHEQKIDSINLLP